MARELGAFESTSYGPPWDTMNGTGVTATGVDLRPAKKKYGVAVDPDVIPLGTKLRIWPNPFGTRRLFEAFDTGGAIKGNRIDFYDWRGRDAQMQWGRRTVQVEKAAGLSSVGLGDILPWGQPYGSPNYDPLDRAPGFGDIGKALSDVAATIGLIANALTTFMQKLGDKMFWLSVGKIALGLWLLMMGLRRIFYIAT